MVYSLYLYPHLSQEGVVSLSLKKSAIIKSLIDNFIIEYQESTLNRYSAGKRLMEFITFLGCSPSLSDGEIEPEININDYNQITGVGGDSINTLRFPACKHIIKEPTTLLEQSINHPYWQCPECSNEGHIDRINWRKSAAFSSLFIEIAPIFPKEAIPTDALLSLLNKSSQLDWAWFYSKSSPQI